MPRVSRLALAALPVLIAGSSALFISVAPASVVGAAVTQAPTLASPSSQSTLPNFGPTLEWSLPGGSTQYQLQVTPFNNDGPGVNIIANAASSFDIPSPPDWYGLLPGMTYTWRVRATDATSAIGEADSNWGPWSGEFSFRTPDPASGALSPDSPVQGTLAASLTPTLEWASDTDDLYYFEVQVSKDSQFGPDAFLYWELRHGGVTNPVNSYTIPSAFPLEAGATYYWRIRPRVQGDGSPTGWSTSASFRTPAQGAIVLNITSPQDGSTVRTSSVTVRGTTKAGALVTVNDAFAMAGSDGSFSLNARLEEGVNMLEVFATDLNTGDTVSAGLVVTYAP